jgi:hypothetical protein
MLLGLLALAVPILAHLLGEETPRVVRFPATRFVPTTDPAPTRRRSLRDRGLLAVRLGALALLASALARPALPATDGISVLGVPHDAVILVDTSASTSLRLREGSILAIDTTRAADLVAALPPGSRVGILGTDPRDPRVEVGPDRARALEVAAELADPAIARSTSNTVAASLDEALALFGDAGEERPAVIYVLTDATARGRGSLPGPSWGRARLVSFAPEGDAPQHVSLSAASWEPTPEVDARAVRVRALVRHRAADPSDQPTAGPSPAGDGGPTVAVTVALLEDGRETARARVVVPAGGEAPVEFTLSRPEGAPAVAVTLALVEPAQDALPIDDRVHAWVSLDHVGDVLVVSGRPHELRTHDETYFLTAALASAGRGAAGQSGGSRRVRVVAPDQLAQLAREHPDELDRLAVVVLANVPAPDPEVAQALERAVTRGVGLLVTVGDAVEADPWNARLGELLPRRLRETAVAGTLPGREQARTEALAPPHLAHPAFAGLSGDLGLLGARTRKLYLVEPDPTREADVLLAFASGSPAVVTGTRGRGRVALLTTTIDRDWTDLPLRPGFVPLVQRLVAWLGAESATSGAGDRIAPGTPRSFPQTTPLHVDGPGGVTLATDATPEGSRVLRDTFAPGHYVARPAEADTAHLDAFVVALDAGESDTTRTDGAPAATADPAATDATLTHTWLPRWHALALLGLALLALEAMVRRHRARPVRQR